MPFHRAENGRRREAEHAGIPDEVSRRDVRTRRGCVGLFDETASAKGSRRRAGMVERVAAFEITESSFGPRRRDAERHQHPLARERRRPCHRRGKGILIGNQVVGGQNQHDGFAAMACFDSHRRECDCGRGVASKRLEDV